MNNNKKKLKTNVCHGSRQTLLNKGFTLIELLAILVILAIIALIAIPQILNLIDDSKKKSAEISVQNYLKAVEVAIMNKEIIEEKVLDGVYKIDDNGKVLDYPDEDKTKDINVEFDGQGLKEGIIKIENNKVVNLDTKIDKWYVILNNDVMDLKDKQENSILVSGSSFNIRLKKLVNPTNNNPSYLTTDEKVMSIEFYSNGILPSGYTKETLEGLGEENRVDVSNDGTIIAYNNNGNIYIVSDNLIIFNEDCNYMFRALTNLKSIQFNNIDATNLTTITEMFAFCNNLLNLNVSNFDTSQVTSMQAMFYNCSNLTELNVSNFNTSNVTSMGGMFMNCSNLTVFDISNFDTSNVINLNEMFRNCSSLTTLDVSNFDTSNVTSMSQVFRGCSNLTKLDLSNFITSKVTTMHGMFAECSSLESLNISSFNTKKVTDMGGMFKNCSNLTTLDINNFDTSEVTNMGEMFNSCQLLTTLDLSNFDTSKTKSMTYMFFKTINLKPIYIGKNWIVNESTYTYMMFGNNSKTENLDQLCKPDSTHEWCVVSVSQ